MTRVPEVTRVAKPCADARLIVDGNGSIRDANAAAHRLLGYKEGTLLGLSLAWIMPPSRHGLIAKLRSAWREGRRMIASGTFMRDDGSTLAAFISAQPCSSERGNELSLTLEIDDEPTTTKTPSTEEPPPPEVSRAVPRAKRHEPEAPASSKPHAAPKTTAPPPPPRASFVSVEPSAPARLDEQLTACVELLRWLDTQLQKEGPREVLRERALVRVVLQEACTLLDQCHGARAFAERDQTGTRPKHAPNGKVRGCP